MKKLRVGWQSCFNKKKNFFWLLYEKNFCRYMKKFLNLVAIFFIWLLYFFIWLLYEFLGENMLLYYWYLGWNKHFRITFSKHRLPKASTNARVALFKIDLQPRGSNVHIMFYIALLGLAIWGQYTKVQPITVSKFAVKSTIRWTPKRYSNC